MTAPTQPTPDRVMQFITGGWASAILGSAAKHGIFNALEGGGDDARGVARKTGYFRTWFTGTARWPDGAWTG